MKPHIVFSYGIWLAYTDTVSGIGINPQEAIFSYFENMIEPQYWEH